MDNSLFLVSFINFMPFLFHFIPFSLYFTPFPLYFLQFLFNFMSILPIISNVILFKFANFFCHDKPKLSRCLLPFFFLSCSAWIRNTEGQSDDQPNYKAACMQKPLCQFIFKTETRNIQCFEMLLTFPMIKIENVLLK